MMNRTHCYWFSSIITIFSFLLIHALASLSLQVCRHDQRDALLEFRDEFPIDASSPSPWNKSNDCCFWEGVTCDDKSGQVILLDLNNTSLNNSLKSNSSLFRLQYLRHLDLNSCHLQGEVPSSLGNLSRLTFLDLSYNSLVGEIPGSIGNLNQLRNLSLGSNGLIGEIPSSVGNFSHLLELKLGYNLLEGEVPASIGNLKELRVMWLGNNSLSGNIPISFANLTKLSYFSITSNYFTSTLPSGMSGFHNLEYFDVSENSFLGPFPKSLFSISSLQQVSLAGNQFTGPLGFSNTSSSSSKLQYLTLARNRFDGPIPESISEFLNLGALYVNDNKLTGPIPRSTSKLVNLEYLCLSNNILEGEIPGFLWRLTALWLSRNFFSSFEKSSQETLIEELNVRSNSFRGPFPHWICKLEGLRLLDLSNNLFNGSIPPCLRTSNLFELNLQKNSFSGTLPDIFTNATELRSFDVSLNQLEGKLPKSLINCKALQLVNVESNKFRDKFPSWLGSLPTLHVLSLRSNEFYGPLYRRHVSNAFQSLKIIDISHNGFTGTLPPYYFFEWREMTPLAEEDDWYMGNVTTYSTFYQSMEMVNKGVDMSFDRIRQDFRAIDFSGNRLYGKIPESIGFLKGLRLLNLSGNAFTSDIPRVLANLTNLEALDLSRNKLSGQIPQELGNLSFLSYMNFSHNLLQGPVPRGTQFQRQKCSSFLDNPGLFGLEDICGETHVPNPTPSQQPEELSESEEQIFNWVAVAIAYGPGVFCGLVIGHIFTSHNQWFTEKFGRRKVRVTTRAR
ncbi:unnamed protein product [Arabis nemorensis]|uniref:Uncharacterized protein n=1 Tax=Arabis nemorensis TaxID=586526 RepID=A0A565AZF3_9BRAS|nr:unnamed protein product [Arabis nemorensis]